MNAANNTNTNTANNSASSTPLPPPLGVGGTNLSGDKEDTSSIASKYSSLMGDSIDGSSTGGGGGGGGGNGGISNATNSSTTGNLNNRYRTEKKITAKVSVYLSKYNVIDWSLSNKWVEQKLRDSKHFVKNNTYSYTYLEPPFLYYLLVYYIINY